VTLLPFEGHGSRLVTKMLTQAHWRPKHALIPGRIYTWQVIALDRQGHEIGRVPERPDTARFAVLAPARTVALAGVRKATNGSHLALGVAFTREGLLDDAEREFQALQAANPQSETTRRLLESLRALRVGA
jgi:hypothetical protein